MASTVFAQIPAAENNTRKKGIALGDTLKLVTLINKAAGFSKVNTDSQFYYSIQQTALARKIGFRLDEAHALISVGDLLTNNYDPRTLEYFFTAMKHLQDPSSESQFLPDYTVDDINYFPYLGEQQKKRVLSSPSLLRKQLLGELNASMGFFFGWTLEDRRRQLTYSFKAFELFRETGDSVSLGWALALVADAYLQLPEHDSALHYAKRSADIYTAIGQQTQLQWFDCITGRAWFLKGNKPLALKYLYEAISLAPDNQVANYTLTELYMQTGQIDSSLYFARKFYNDAKNWNSALSKSFSVDLLARVYRSNGMHDSAAKYAEMSFIMRDSIRAMEKMRIYQAQAFEEELRQQEQERSRVLYKNRIRTIVFISGLLVLSSIALMLFYINRKRKKTNLILEQQKREIEKAMNDLKLAQYQLVQREKMASLGEMTAGIAHEIQNPLNFVNNFSELNTEISRDIQKAAETGDLSEVRQLAADMETNQVKIREHGGRIGAIVASMLEHSKGSTGQKEMVNFNKLVEEYAMIAYNGMKARDKHFYAECKTSFDDLIGEMKIIPRDIGRVVINLMNNAFDAVHEKAKISGDNYVPSVSISTERTLKAGNQPAKVVILTVKDNGKGVPLKNMDKIFHPFFTTKPAGQGTGLGLSLSYDIVKAHGGEITVESVEGEGSEFKMILPV
jgi:signal transduction histidine kinase